MTYYLGKSGSSSIVINLSYSLSMDNLLLSIAINDSLYNKKYHLSDLEVKSNKIKFQNNIFDVNLIKYEDENMQIKIVFETRKEILKAFDKIDSNLLFIDGYGKVLTGQIHYNGDIIELLDYKMIFINQLGKNIASNYIINYGYDFENFDGFYFLKVSNINHQKANILFLYEIHGKIKKLKSIGKVKYQFIENQLHYFKVKIDNSKEMLWFQNILYNEFKISEISSGIGSVYSFISINNNISLKIRDEYNNLVLNAKCKAAISERIMYL